MNVLILVLLWFLIGIAATIWIFKIPVFEIPISVILILCTIGGLIGFPVLVISTIMAILNRKSKSNLNDTT